MFFDEYLNHAKWEKLAASVGTIEIVHFCCLRTVDIRWISTSTQFCRSEVLQFIVSNEFLIVLYSQQKFVNIIEFFIVNNCKS